MLICKTSAGDALLFIKIIDTRNPEDVSNFDLKSITSWTYQWKMRFNYDSKKQGNEVIFSWKSNTSICPPVTFNKNIIATCPHQNHLGVLLDSKLDFSIHSY